MAFLNEGFSTQSTGEWSDTKMSLLVRVEVPITAECLITDVTLERFLVLIETGSH